MLSRWRRKAGGIVVEVLYHSLSGAGRLHPMASPVRSGITVERDLPYGDGPARRLDVWRPSTAGRAPAGLYLPGGGFRMLSQATHWRLALAYARAGYVVFNADYRLAPSHPYPAAVADACAAWRWVAEHAAEHGADPDRLVVAGESAGANLAACIALASSYRRPEPWASAVFDADVAPRAVVAACGLFEVSDTDRFLRSRRLPVFVGDRISEVSEAYLARADPDVPRTFADPLVHFESGARPDRPLPPVFAPVGTADPVLDDTRRLERALSALGTRCDARYYDREIHAFHAFVWRPAARRCWADTFAFLDEILGGSAARDACRDDRVSANVHGAEHREVGANLDPEV